MMAAAQAQIEVAQSLSRPSSRQVLAPAPAFVQSRIEREDGVVSEELMAAFPPPSPEQQAEADRILRTMASQNDMLHALPAGTLRESPAAAAALEADGHGGGKMEVGSIRAVLAPGVRWLAVLMAYVWFAGGCLYYGVILVQPDIITAEHSGERCPEYGLVTLPTVAESPWLSSSASNASGAAAGGAELPGSNRWCALRLTSEDYASTFVAAVGEFPGVLVSLLMVDRLGRRATIGDSAAVCGAVCLLLIPCSFYWLEQGLIFVARGAANGLFQTTFVLTSELYPSTVRATAMGLGASFARVRALPQQSEPIAFETAHVCAVAARSWDCW